ncbi:talin-2 [Trichonephila inaurata madagascariensis]|uniref:Talin-2 n=1 Tax=Trichonephila inaurata madagascariensis TaxID=2747483 RepID=A0A8X6X520_9ARAC|nr:talin-2 [Trichonephila inaurata madagascariensis]
MSLSLKVSVVDKNVVKTMQFDPSTIVYDACRIIREKISEGGDSGLGESKNYGLFLADEDPKKGVWLESGRSLEYYLLRNGDLLEYKRKMRTLRVRMLDGTVKTVLVDDSQVVANLMVVICTKIGITNHDEFSLIRDIPDENKEPNTGTLTLRKEKKDKDKDQKMEQLKKKLKTDDDLNWVDHSKTLREQGIDEEETLLLRRKFFFSDQNVDSRDPVQLNLLYVQARDAIINGTHPVTVEQASQFAGMQCQIQFGDHVETKHKPGFLDLKEFLPKDYAKMKGIEKRVFVEHKKFSGNTELEAKVKYVSLARSLKTYGVAFFLVKEKMKGKNKLVPRLLGVTKDSVLRLDEKTKEDFGDYSDSYYSVQTPEGEQISQLIGGYIDIILKRKQAKDHFGIEGDEGSTMVEDNISAAKATILQHNPPAKVSHGNSVSVVVPAVMRAAENGARQYNTGQTPSAQFSETKGQAHSAYAAVQPQHPKIQQTMSEPQRALLSTISAGRSAVENAQNDLSVRVRFQELGNDPASLQWKQDQMDVKKQNVSSQLAAMNAATAQVITLTSGPPEEVDHPAFGAAVTTIATNLTEMSKDVKVIAALMDDDAQGENLLDAARNLCSAFYDLLKAAEPETKEPRQNLLNAASRVGEASHAVLRNIGEEDAIDKEIQDILLGLAKRVANATANLVLKAKNVASKCDDTAQQNRVITAATQCALTTSQLVACAKVVAPTISNPTCQQQLIEAAKEVSRAVEGINKACNEATKDEALLNDMGQASGQVEDALADLVNHIKTASKQRAQASVHDGAVDTILDATDRLFSSTGDAGEMVRQAKILATATATLIQAIKGEASSQTDSDVQKRLLAAAKVLADATAKMGCASNPHDSASQAALQKAAEDLRSATNAAANNALKRKLIRRLEQAAKHTAAMKELLESCKEVAEAIPKLVHGVKGTMADVDNPSAQLALISSCEAMLQPGNKMVSASKAAIPTITDQSTSLQLSNATKQMINALMELRTSLLKAQEACGSLELENALDLIRGLDDELIAFRKAAENMELRPLPGETMENSALQLGAISKVVGSSMAQLLTAASQGNENYTGIAARDTGSALKILTKAVRGVAATSSDRDVQVKIIDNARDVLDKSTLLIQESQRAMNNPSNPDIQQRLTQVAKSVSTALNNCVNCLPGQKDVDDAIKSITETSQILNSRDFPQTNKSYGELQSNLSNAAANLNVAASDVVASSKGSPSQLATSSKKFGRAFNELMDSGVEMIGGTKDAEIRGSMVVSLKNVSMVSSKLLVAAKSVAADPGAPNAKNQLAAAARSVTESINNLINVCTSATPGQKECDNAIRNIQSLRPLLDNPVEPISDLSYYECLDAVTEKSKNLGVGMTGIANYAKVNDQENFGSSVNDVSNAVCGLVEAAAQSAYLVGVSDPSSVAGRQGLVDVNQFARANQAIQTACQQLTSSASKKQQVLAAATVIAQHTSALCNSCRIASSKTSNPVAKRHFVQSAKDVANATANLVKEIKALDQEPTDKNRQNTSAAIKPLVEAVENLTTFASSAEFASVPAKISAKAKVSQEPITSAGKSIIDGSCNMIMSAKSLVVNPKDPPTWQTLANNSKNVSDSIKKLVASIKDKAPGQKECDAAIEKLSTCIRELDRASLSIISQNLEPRTDYSLKGYQEQMETSASEIMDRIDGVRNSAKGEAEKLGHLVTQMTSFFEPLVQSAIGSASKTLNSKQQMALLDQTKTVAESALQLIYASKEAGGNPKATHIYCELDESADGMKDALHDLLQTLEAAATEAGVVTGLVDTINKSIVKVDEHTGNDVSESSFVDYQTRMVTSSKEIAKIAQDMIVKSTTDAAQLGPLAAKLAHLFANVAGDTRGAVASTSNLDVANRIKSSVQDLGSACIDLTKAAGSCQSNPTDTYSQRDVSDNARTVTEKVSFVLAALQAGSRETFSDHRENILKTAKALVEDTKTLVAGAASSQEQLAVAAQNAVTTIIQLAEVVKLGAASLGANNSDAQVLLINAVKDVATALGDLVQATKAASGKSIHDPAMIHLRDSAKVMVTNVTSLLKTVKSVEDEHSRGTRALESTIEAIAQEIRAYDSPDPPMRSATAEDLVRATKPVTLATAKAVASGKSCKQEDIIVAANMGRKAIFDLLMVSKAAAYTSETSKLKQETLASGHNCAVHFRELLQMVHQVVQKPTMENKQQLGTISRTIALSVQEVVSCAESLKGADWEDPDDPMIIAENELLGAANSIDAAAKKLANLKPRISKHHETDESLNFDEMILEAAKSIAAATSALVKAASAAQRELVAAGKVGSHTVCTTDDGQWSEGLISAAKLVAAATHSLVEAANSLVQGHASEEKLISSAKQVASSTAQLLVACKVKADPDSQSMHRLQQAGNAVKRATDNLVRAAQQAIEHDEERSLVINKRMVGGIAQEIVAREEILRKERELEEAREKLAALRKAKYGNRSPDEYQGYGSQ